MQSASGTCYVLPGSGSLKITGFASGCSGSGHKSEFSISLFYLRGKGWYGEGGRHEKRIMLIITIVRAYGSAGCPVGGAYQDFTSPFSCYSMAGRRSMRVYC